MTLPAHIDMCIRAIGVIPKRHTSVHIPQPQPKYEAWKPTPDEQEPPF